MRISRIPNARNGFTFIGEKVKAILFLITFITLSGAAFAHEPFSLVSKDKRTVKESEIADLAKSATVGTVTGTVLTFTEKDIRLVVTGEGRAYQIQGVKNPTLAIPAAATLRVLFINTDKTMRHDIFFGHIDPIEDTADTSMSVGTSRLTEQAADGTLQAEEIVIKADSLGEYNYFCSVRGHAIGGMAGSVAIGVKPRSSVTAPAKAESASHDGHAGHGTPAATPTPSPSGHDHHQQTPAASPTPASHDDHSQHSQKQMSSTVDINDPMGREGSGTSWLPDSSPMYGYTRMYKDGGMLMLMGTAFLRYTQVGSTRDVSVGGKGSRSRIDAPNMFMAMYSRPLTDRSQLGLRLMASLDPITQRGYGYPLLYQSGELYRGEPIHDRQHPHDFISELAASYSYKVNKTQSVFVYGGIAGEPALGPSMFMHRLSGMNNPDAPISHHWQDASHITWGVITGGYNFGKFKIEGSVMNGTEPDENRWAFDSIKLNSFSGRFSVNPTKDLSFQISHAFLKKPERAEPDLDHMHRTTASMIYNKNFSEEKNWASTFVWGNNYKEDKATNAFLFESDFTFGKNAVFGRIERVQKDGHELVIPHSDPIHNDTFWVGAYSIGYIRDIVKDKGIDVGLGGMTTFNTNPAALVPYYGGTKHSGFQFFLRFRPSKMKH